MMAVLEAYLYDIAEQVSETIGGCLDVSTARWIPRPPDHQAVSDATLALYIDGKRARDDVVLLISSPSFPDTVGEDVVQAQSVAARLGPSVARHIVSPLCEGRAGRQSWAAFSRLSALSAYRMPRLFQKQAAAREILPWLSALAHNTKDHKADPSDYDACFIRPLEHLASRADLSSALRRFVDGCHKTVLKDRPDLFTVAEHGDFWIGNILFERRGLSRFDPRPGDFRVIDWRGARLEGYPCTDAIRFTASLRSKGFSRSDCFLHKYLKCLKISGSEMDVYCLASLGRLGEDLDQFPQGRYRQMCEVTFAFLSG